jgi:hypothetical protein
MERSKNPRPSAESLSKEEAMKEAEMMSGLLVGWLGWMQDGQRSREDYEHAQAVVNQIKTAAAEESDISKLAYQTARILRNVARVPFGAIATLDDLIGSAAEFTVPPSGRKPLNFNEARVFRHGNVLARPLEDIDTWLTEKLTNPGKELRDLEKGGRDYIKNQ